jgi:hypothetical protein
MHPRTSRHRGRSASPSSGTVSGMPPPRPGPTSRAGTRRSPGGTPVPPPSPAGPRPRSARFCPRRWAPREFGYPIHAASVFPPLSPGAGNRSPKTSGSRSYTGCSSDRTRILRASAYPLPARPYWPSPSPRRPAPPTSRYRTAFPAASARPCSSSRNLPVDQTNQPRMTRPLRSPAITAGSPLLRAGPPAHAAPVLSASRVMPLERAPSHHPAQAPAPRAGQQYRRAPSQVPRGSRRPGSRRLHAGHRLASRRAPARLIPGAQEPHGFDAT